MSLGMRNALMHFHMGRIQLALGRIDRGEAELRSALAINPYFSVRYAQLARELAS